MELIECFVSNLHPVIINRVIIMDCVLNAKNKYPDNIIMSFGKRFQCFSVCCLTDIWYICIRYVDKAFNTFIVIVD